MGLFSKKKTKTEKIDKKIVESRIVKFSYLQSLAIESGLGTAKEFSGETEASEETIDETDVRKNKAERINSDLNEIPDLLDFAFFDNLGDILGSIGSALFGKEVTKKLDLKIKDSGWNFVKSWKEPQFDIIRYAIGVRELTVSQFRYVPVSEFVSVPFSSPKDIQKVSLIVDQFIPSQFPPGVGYIEYYIKPEVADAEWIRINGVDLPTQYDENGNIIPRIITFNTEQSVNANLEESYIETGGEIKSIRFKAIIKRPETIEGNNEVSADSYTPILRSYKLLMYPRGGL